MSKQNNTLSQEDRKKGGQHSHGGNKPSQNAATSNEGKNTARVEAGKKAAETRGHASLAAAGRKGGEHTHHHGKSES